MKNVELSIAGSGSTQLLSQLALGCSHVGSIGNPTPHREVIRTLDAAVDLGITVFDTASIYGQGDSEKALGDLQRRHRDKLFIITKYGGRFSLKMRVVSPFKPLLRPLISRFNLRSSVVSQRKNNLSLDFSQKNLAASVASSLRRLRMDRLDALLMHSPGAAVLRDSAQTDALLEVRDKGLARHVGVSVDDVEALGAAVALPFVTMVQATLTVLDDPRGQEAAALLRARGGIVLAREIIAERGSMTPTQAVAQSLQRADVDVVVVRTSRVAHLRELAAVANR